MLSSGILGALLVIANTFGTLGAVGAEYFILAISIVYGTYEELVVDTLEKMTKPL
jgi:preprotein translocase subunit SecY